MPNSIECIFVNSFQNFKFNSNTSIKILNFKVQQLFLTIQKACEDIIPSKMVSCLSSHFLKFFSVPFSTKAPFDVKKWYLK